MLIYTFDRVETTKSKANPLGENHITLKTECTQIVVSKEVLIFFVSGLVEFTLVVNAQSVI